MRSRRVLVLMHEDLIPPDSLEGYSDKQIALWKTEYDVVSTLYNSGHDVMPLGVRDDLGVIRDAIEKHKPHIAFNLLEEFHGISLYDQHVVSYLELMRQPYTGCNPRGLTLGHDKALSKKLLSYHRISVPRFAVFPIGQKVRRSEKLTFPLFVKSLTEHASLGIAQASVVHNDEKLKDRVAFIHEQVGTDAIVEQYIDGRELYVSVIGNMRLQVYPTWELKFDRLPERSLRIATGRGKWDESYQEKIGLHIGPANELPDGAEDRLQKLCRRAYKVLGLTGYARLDVRMTEAGEFYLIEANPNPDIAYGGEFAESANAAGIDYPQLLDRIMSQGMRYRALWRTNH